MKNLFKNVIAIALVVGVFISCDSDEDNIPNGQGAVVVKLTDDPFPFGFVTEANVGLAKVELMNASGEYTVVFEGSSSYNMVGLTNGVTETVATANIEVGTYHQARITLNAASVNLSNGVEYEMNADAQGSYIISIEPALVVEEGDYSDILFDLDINDSFEFSGMWLGDWVPDVSSILGCSFDAEFRACDLDQTGEIVGTVSVSGNAESNAYVSIEIDGEQIATQTEANGSFRFIGVADGNYTVAVETESNGSILVTNVQVSSNGTATCTVEL